MNAVQELVDAVASELAPTYHVTPGGLKWSKSTDALRGLATLARAAVLTTDTTQDWLDALEARFEAEKTEDWTASPYKRTPREYAARQALMCVHELRSRIANFDRALQ